MGSLGQRVGSQRVKKEDSLTRGGVGVLAGDEAQCRMRSRVHPQSKNQQDNFFTGKVLEFLSSLQKNCTNYLDIVLS